MCQEMVLVYAQVVFPSHAPISSPESSESSSEPSWVCLPNSFATIWSTEVPTPSSLLRIDPGQERSAGDRMVS